MSLIASLVLITLAVLPLLAWAWNIPRPYALRGHRLPGRPAREAAEYGEDKSTAGETSLVRESMAGEASRLKGGGFLSV